MHISFRVVALVGALATGAALSGAVAVACGGGSATSSGAPEAGPVGFDFDATPESSVKCTGLECQIASCVDDPAGTRVLGTVTDPAGTSPVYNAVVWVPNAPLAPLTTGASCDRCDDAHSGAPLRITKTDAAGRFELDNIPAGTNIPLVVQIGKWRRTIRLPDVSGCSENTVTIQLPKNRAEGDIPRIAIATGAADALPCLLRKIGIDDSEVGIAGSEARIHLFKGGGYADDGGAPRVASSSFVNGQSFPDAESLWNDPAALAKYDAVLLACEGAANDDAVHKSPAAKQALYDYAKAGGRVLATHYHDTFFSGSPDPAPRNVAAWSDHPGPAAGDPRTTSVDTDVVGTFPKALAMRTWLSKQGALTAAGKLPLFDARHDVDGVDGGALSWIEAANPSFPTAPAVQYLTFDTPIGASAAGVCGRVAFTNVHFGPATGTALTDDPTQPYPASCQTMDLTAQQKALELMLFDLVSCAQLDDAAVVTPH
ncbi:MAG: Tryptophan synthase alpha chain [Myxococcaceae bacterium]|nr:Tryptophan synthase alpha chain [Myxococcaceae bacterium]